MSTDDTPKAIAWEDLLEKARGNRELIHRLVQDPAAVVPSAQTEDGQECLEMVKAYARQQSQGVQEVAEELQDALLG